MSQFGSSQMGGQRPLQGLASSTGGLPKPIAPPKPVISSKPADETSSIGLIHEDDAAAAEGKIKTIGVSAGNSVRKENYARTPATPGTGACRIRSFHGRLSTQGLEYMDNQVNEWLDAHPEVEVKFVTSTVGVFEGKMREPALILNLWY